MSTTGTASSGRDRRWTLPSPIATAAEVALEPAPFPLKTSAMPIETFFDDWRCRLTRNLSRRTTGRWEPLTWTHSAARSGPEV